MKKKIGDLTLREAFAMCDYSGSSCNGCPLVTDTQICMSSTKYNNFYNNEIELPDPKCALCPVEPFCIEGCDNNG